jgi:hypothetical protein
MNFKIQNSKFKIQRVTFFCFLLIASSFLVGCSQPILESQQCIESRDVVKKFYSYHFGNDMKPSAENLELRKKYLSENLIQKLSSQNEEKIDYFTQTDDYPKAFRVGGCEDISPERTAFEILIFWKTPTRSEQRALKVETLKENSKWTIEKVETKN